MARVDAAPVCVVMLTYIVPTETVDAHMTAHVAWLKQGFDQGIFLLAGRQVPRVGGVIVCRGSRADVSAVMATDPFVTNGVATIAVTEMATSFATDDIASLLV